MPVDAVKILQPKKLCILKPDLSAGEQDRFIRQNGNQVIKYEMKSLKNHVRSGLTAIGEITVLYALQQVQASS